MANQRNLGIPLRLRVRIRAAFRAFVSPILNPGQKFIALSVLWPVALVLGVATGYATLGFRLGISHLQTLVYGADEKTIHSAAAALPWFVVLAVPILGGLAVGWILTRFTSDGKAQGVADVIQAAALRGGKIERKSGLASAAAALVTLSTGGSTGREGPAVHLGAILASWVSERLNASGITSRDILACAAAAAVSASFNAPLAGALFAMEVVLRHYALHAFGPVVVAAVAGAVVSRIHLGDVTEFSLAPHTIEFYLELPAFFLLGIVCGLAGAIMVHGIFFAGMVGDRVQKWFSIPPLLRPAVAGALLGLLALEFPHVIGVGYQTTTQALTAQFPFEQAVLFAVIKVVAVAITIAGNMGGGVFSPALMVGALTGCAFGAVATDFFPALTAGQGLYALAGVGAVAGAVIGSPISTTLIVFELTGDFQVAIAVMITVSVASVVADQMGVRSFFITQLERKGLMLSSGPQGYLAATVPVRDLMRRRDRRARRDVCRELVAKGVWLSADATLDTALPMFDQTQTIFIPVVQEGSGNMGSDGEEQPETIGALFRGDAYKAYSGKLEEELREEHT